MATVAIETNLLRKAFVDVSRSTSAGTAERILREDFLGRAEADTGVRLLDLEVLAWLTAGLKVGSDSVSFRRQDLGRDLYGRRPGGVELRAIDDALLRLLTNRLSFGGYDALHRQTISPTAFVNVRLVQGIDRAQDDQWVARFPPWLLSQLELGYVTFVDWDTMRTLRGLAKRLWLYLQAERFATHPSAPLDAVPQTYILLGARGLAALGVGRQAQGRALARLRAATQGIERITDTYRFSFDERRGTPVLIVHRNAEPTAIRIGTPRMESSRFDLAGALIGNKRRSWTRLSTWDRDSKELVDAVPADQRPEDPGWTRSGSLSEVTRWDQVLRACPEAAFVLIYPALGEPELHRAESACLLSDLVHAGRSADEGAYVLAESVFALWDWCDMRFTRRPAPCPLCSRTAIA